MPMPGGDEGLHGLAVVDLEEDVRLEAGDGARAAHQPVVGPAVALTAAREQEVLRRQRRARGRITPRRAGGGAGRVAGAAAHGYGRVLM